MIDIQLHVDFYFQCKEGTFINEMFMTVIKTTDSVAELVSVIDIVDCDIARWRSKDTGGSDGMSTLSF